LYHIDKKDAIKIGILVYFSSDIDSYPQEGALPNCFLYARTNVV